MKRFLSTFILLALHCITLGFEHHTALCENNGFYKGMPSVPIEGERSSAGISQAVSVSHVPIHHIPSSYVYDTDIPLERLSVEQLTDYFRGCNSAEIFSRTNLSLLTSDAFVAYIKQFPEYEGYIEHFHEKFHKSSTIKQWLRKEIGKRLCQLHQEIEHKKKIKQAKIRSEAYAKYEAKQYATQHAYLFDRWQCRYERAQVDQKARLARRMHLYESTDLSVFSLQQSVLSPTVVQLLHAYDIDPAQLTSVHGSALEHLLQEEFVTIAERAAMYVSARGDPYHELLIEGIDVGTMAVQKKHTVLAYQAADFCWALLDLVQAAGEGVVLAGYNTAAFLHHIVCHPQETAQAFIDGICMVADTLFIINDLPDQLREHDIPNKEYYYCKIAQTEQQLEDLGTVTAQRMKEMKLRDWVKHGTAFVVEGLLLHKVTQLTVKACSRIGPLLGDLLRSIEYEEAVAACVDGEKIPLGRLAPELTVTAENVVSKVSAGVAPELFTEESEKLLALLGELETVNSNKVCHILQEHHMWDRICTKYVNWESVKELLVRTIKHGEQSSYKGLPSRVLKIGEEQVEIVYIRAEDGLKISNAWVKNG